MLEREERYFKWQQKFLRDEYPGKFVVISGETVVGVYDDKFGAFETELYGNFRPIGSFLVCHVDEDLDKRYAFLGPRLTSRPPE